MSAAVQMQPEIEAVLLEEPVDDHEGWITFGDYLARTGDKRALIVRYDRHLAAARKLVGLGALRSGEGPWFFEDAALRSFLFKFDRRGETVMTSEARS